MADATADQASLARAAAGGDREAFAALCRQAGPRLHRIAWRILGDEDQAADALQETLIKLADGLHRFDPDRPLWPWLQSIAVRCAIDLQRRERRAGGLPLEAAGEPAGPRSDRPDHRLEMDEYRALLGRLLEDLTPQQREVFTLRDLADVPAADVAAALGMSPSTVRVHLARARHRLRSALAAREVLP
ncbi:sigma-70 family RNA polymerase sigma factor [bacterium]|nr:sigma-70 family RNA polymerase sigma factor [bacterium]